MRYLYKKCYRFKQIIFKTYLFTLFYSQYERKTRINMMGWLQIRSDHKK